MLYFPKHSTLSETVSVTISLLAQALHCLVV